MARRKPASLEELASDARVTVRKPGPPDPEGKCVVYWMQRSHRGFDNPALDVAVHAANILNLPCVVYLAPIPFYPHANLRHYAFLNEGIADIAAACKERNVGFVLRRYPDHQLVKFCDEVKAALIIGDENPMREPEHWRVVTAKRVRVPLWTVDADVIVPTKLLEKEQFAAHIIRPRLMSRLDEYLKPLDNPVAHIGWKQPKGLLNLPLDTDVTEGWELDRSVQPVPKHWRGGSREALRLLKEFVKHKLANYETERNKPNIDGTSKLSPYLHFGHIGPHTALLAVMKADAPQKAKDSFLNEILIWRELSINFVKYNPHYDSIECADNWSRKNMAETAQDQREHLYSERQLEQAETHDPLWNAAQEQMVLTGWMHNYMRMYWAKKILEWTPSPAVAYRLCVKLNDKYFLCGRDPNGYNGIAWAIVGKHDRPWFRRPVYGQIRSMSYNAAIKKFDADSYIEQVKSARTGLVKQGNLF